VVCDIRLGHGGNRGCFPQVRPTSRCRPPGRFCLERRDGGRVDDLVRTYAVEWGLKPAETTAYLCGHPSMSENGQGILARPGWQKGSMFEEVYFILGKEAGAE
jgi:hypothetical protein